MNRHRETGPRKGPLVAAAQRKRTRSGFTLIEILLVVVIIGLLLGIGVPNLVSRLRGAERTRAQADIKAISMALDMYRMDNGTYPPNLQALITRPESSRNWDGPYMEEGLPKDPWGGDYLYQYPGTRRTHSFDLHTQGSAETGPITNWTEG